MLSFDQGVLLAILAAALALFIWDRWRHDAVAMLGLIAAVLFGVVEPHTAFSGFANPAVITVAALLILSRAVTESGAIDLIATRLTRRLPGYRYHLAALCVFGASLSAFMNNVAALALLMPVALSTARRFDYSPGLVLMPLSFATLLGGMTTLIGTPPNLLIAEFRREATGTAFGMFDFAPVGLVLSVLGVVYLLSLGWRFLPKRAPPVDSRDLFAVEDYVSEVEIAPRSNLIGVTVADFEVQLPGRVIGIVRHGQRMFGRVQLAALEAGDIVLLQAGVQALEKLVQDSGAALIARNRNAKDPVPSLLSVTEAVIMPNSVLQGSSPRTLGLRQRWGISLLAAAQQGRRFDSRLRDARLHAGDVLLLEGEPERVQQAMAELDCLPLANRRISFDAGRVLPPVLVFALAIAVTAIGLLPPEIAFPAAVLPMLATRSLRRTQVYDSIDWPVIILLGAMIPLGEALESTGTAKLFATSLLGTAGDIGPRAILALVLAATMVLTPMLNNAATVVIMAPIAISVAATLGMSPDGLLIAVAIGASCDFLTPFGHHNNTLVMGPGGYRFGDYWPVGLPLNAIVLAASVLIIPLVWPLV